DVVWTFNTRFQGDKDIIVLPGMRNHPLDPSELPEYNPGSIRFRGMSAKTIFDGTVPFDMKEHFVRAKFQEVEDWEKYLK
ncbi:UbiD family decarboxylase, partial [Enterococcus lactis]|nr:UbiD family decarboxylase [Enterococcus lactis]